MRASRLPAVVALALIVCASLSVSAKDQWNDNKGTCEDIFEKYKSSTMLQLYRCVNVWETYKDVSKLNDAQRFFVAKPFMRLYYEGNDRQSRLAKSALARVGVKAPKKVPNVKSILEMRPYNPKYSPTPGSKSGRKRAKKLNGLGFKAYKKNNYDKALSFYLKAIQADPLFTTAIYNAACMYGKKGNKLMASRYLWNLKDLGSKKSLEYVNKARIDGDFSSIRETTEFKAATGYVKIKLLNGLVDKGGEFGDAELKKLGKNLTKLKYPVASTDKDKHHRTFPIVFFKPQFKIQAVFFMAMLNHKSTTLAPIDWASDYDVIITWGDKIKKDKEGNVVPPKPKVMEPEDFEKKFDKISKKQDDYLKKPEQVAQKTDKILNKPVEYEKKVKDIIDRPSKTLDRLKRTKDKLERLGKKIGL